MGQIRFLALVLVVSLAAGIAGFVAARHWYAAQSAEIGTAAPDVYLVELDGQRRPLSHWRGKLLLVNFWASWCAPCIKEIPLLVKAQNAYGARGLQIIGPALDEPDAVRALVQRFSVNYPVMADFASADAALKALGNEGGALPYTVLISPDGEILAKALGGMSADEIERLIETFLPG